MADDVKHEYPKLPDLHIGNVAPAICHKMGVSAAMVVTQNADGTISLTGHGVNHFQANLLLSTAIHLNMSQHDDLVRAGAAGEAAKETQLRIDAEAAGGSQ